MGKETDESDAPLHVEITGVKLMGGSQDLLKMKIMKITVGGEIKHLPLVEICRKTAHFFFYIGNSRARTMVHHHCSEICNERIFLARPNVFGARIGMSAMK